MKSEAKKAEYKVIHSWIKTEPKEKIFESYKVTFALQELQTDLGEKEKVLLLQHTSAHFPTA